jgi:polyhydroxyalkanoate synthesis regulator phasin
MALGAEMLINSLVKAVGLDTDEVKQTAAELMALAQNAKPQIQQLINWNVAKVQEFDARLRDMEAQQSVNNEIQRRIAEHLGIEIPKIDTVQPVVQIEENNHE